MLFKIRHLCPKSVLRSLYFSLFNSHLAYGLSVWGNTDQIYIQKLENLQKKAVRAITFADFKAPSQPLLKELKILSISDMCRHQISSLMWDLDKDLFPPSLSTYFTKRNLVHNHDTKQAASGKLCIRKNTTITILDTESNPSRFRALSF